METGMFWALFGLTWVFGWVIVGLVGTHLKNKRRNERLRMLHAERMKAMEKGLPLPEFPELAEVNGGVCCDEPSSPSNPRSTLGAAAIMASIGVGLAQVFYLWGELAKRPELQNLWVIGLLPVFIGLGLVFYYYLTRPEES